ncbi:conserved hypothetical protein [Gammaproteobacteria bacterium]
MPRSLRFLWSMFWSVFAVSVIAAAVVLSLGRLLLPMAHGYRAEIAAWATTALGQEVRIAGLEAEWQGLWPVLRLRGVSIAGGRAHGGAEIEAVDLILDLAVSLHQLRLVPAELSLVHPQLTVNLGRDSTQKNWALDGPDLWQLGQSRIVMRNVRICLGESSPPSVQELRGCLTGNAQLRSDGRRLQGDADLRLPTLWGETVHLVLDAYNDGNKSHRWEGEWYLETKGLRLSPLLHRLRPEMVVDGAADLRLWGSWDEIGLARLEGAVDRLLVQAGDSAQGPRDLLLTLEGFSWVRRMPGWQLDLTGLHRLDTLNSGATLQVRLDGPLDAQELHLQATDLSLPELAFLAGVDGVLPGKMAYTLAALAPRGNLQELRLRFPLTSTVAKDQTKEQSEEPSQSQDQKIFLLSAKENFFDSEILEKLEVRARFTGLAIRAWQGIPGVEGLTGQLQLAGGAGTLDLEERHGKLYPARLFRGPWTVNRLATTVTFQRNAGSWQLSMPKLTLTTPELALEASGTLLVPPSGAGRSPRLDLEAHLPRADAGQLPVYLPRRAMPRPAAAWLDRSILGGKISRGAVHFHGNLADFPFDHGEGRFEVNCQVTGGELNYDPNWPALHALDTSLVFRGRAMEIHARAGRILDGTLEDTTVTIPDLDQEPPLLQVRGQVRGPMADIPRLIRDSPLARRYGQYVTSLEGRGAMALALELDMHTKPVEITRVTGHVDLLGADLHWHDPKVALDTASGTLEFSSEGIRGRGIAARILDLPVELAIQSKMLEGRPSTVIDIQGRLEPTDIQTYLSASLLNRLHGRTAWQAIVTLPDVPPGGKPAPLVRLESDLRGLGLDLPSPFAKSAEQTQVLRLETTLGGEAQRKIQVSYGTLANAVVELNGDGQLTQGEVQLGKGATALPTLQRGVPGDTGLFRLQADLVETALDDWLALAAGVTEGGKGGPDFVLEAKVGDLRAGDHHFHGVDFLANRKRKEWEKGWEARFTTHETTGRLHWSDDSGLDLDLDRLTLTESAQESSEGNAKKDSRSAIDPRHLPPLHLRCADLHFGRAPITPTVPASEGKDQKRDDVALGQMEIRTHPDPEGLSVTDLHLHAATFRADGKGHWRVADTGDITKGQSSTFDLNFETDDLGNTLNALGYIGAVEGGPGTARLQAKWHGAPNTFSTEHLDGTLVVEVGKGRLLQINPGGTGRIFGLLSLQALPRRLALDFSDVFHKGLTFDHLQGDFRIEHGNAYSNNLKLQGPAADIKVEGRTGLATQDYDQVVTVTPNVGGTLPLAGALAAGSVGIGVGVGAAILLAQHLLQPNIDRITQVRYTLHGPWENPVVEPLH